MATFFDTSAQADLDILHSSVRTHDELDNVVDKVEWEILNYYRQRPSIPLTLKTGRENLYTTNEIQVRLLDYDNDTPSNSEAGVKDALRRAIGEVASWVLRNYDNTQGAGSITQGKRSITYINPSDWRTWPDGWSRILKNYDDREALYSI